MRTVKDRRPVVISLAVKEIGQLTVKNKLQKLTINHESPLFRRQRHCRVRQALVKNKQTRLQHVRLQRVVNVADVTC